MFWISLIGSLFLLFLIIIQETPACYDKWEWCRTFLWDFVNFNGPFFFALPIVFFLSLITRKLRDEVFYTWLKFSAFTIPVILFFIFKSPESAYGGALASTMTVTRAQAALQLSVIYLIISLILITYKHFTLKRNRTGK